MVTLSELKVQDIVCDETMSTEEKIERLRRLESDARALQRAASESPMNDHDGWDSDLREVRKALSRLGAEEAPKGAASL